MRIQLFKKINNIDRLAKIVFFNFIELQNENDIVFNIDDITSTLSSNNLLGWFLINDDDRIIGYLIGELKEMTDGRYVYYLSYIYIINSYRLNGLGTNLLKNCIKYIKSINIPFIMLISNINSTAFNIYRKLGFGFDPIIKINNPNYAVLLLYTN